jgi:GntR family transcriptional regulator
VRRQGRGTFVAEVEESQILFQFFRLAPDKGGRQFPESSVQGLTRGHADQLARSKLELSALSPVWLIDRTRSIGGRPVISERIVVPADRFPDLDRLTPIPNNVYALYAMRFGLRIGRAAEQLKAVAASAADARALGCPKGTPLLAIDRVAFAIDGTPIEWRRSRCLTDRLRPQLTLRRCGRA